MFIQIIIILEKNISIGALGFQFNLNEKCEKRPIDIMKHPKHFKKINGIKFFQLFKKDDVCDLNSNF
jgi:hypothetical protein